MRVLRVYILACCSCLGLLAGCASPSFGLSGPKGYWQAVAEGNLRKVRRYIEDGYNVNMTYRNRVNSLHIAAEQGHYHLVRYLVEKGAFINYVSGDGDTALSIAASKNNLSIIEHLLDAKANINTAYPLYQAVGNNHFEASRLLIDRGADVNKLGRDGLSALHVAVTRENVEIIKLLLQHGARPDIVAVVKDLAVRPIDIAMGLKNDEIVKMLTEPQVQTDPQASGGIALVAMDSDKVRATAVKAVKKKYPEIDIGDFRPGYIICMAHESAPVNNPIIAEWYGTKIVSREKGATPEADRVQVMKLKVIMSKFGEVEDIEMKPVWLYRNSTGGLEE